MGGPLGLRSARHVTPSLFVYLGSKTQARSECGGGGGGEGRANFPSCADCSARHVIRNRQENGKRDLGAGEGGGGGGN